MFRCNLDRCQGCVYLYGGSGLSEVWHGAVFADVAWEVTGHADGGSCRLGNIDLWRGVSPTMGRLRQHGRWVQGEFSWRTDGRERDVGISIGLRPYWETIYG